MTGAMNTMISHRCSDECDAQLLNMDTLPYHMDWKINVMFSYRTGISFGSRCLVTGGSKSETTAWCVVWCIHCPILIQQSVMTWQTEFDATQMFNTCGSVHSVLSQKGGQTVTICGKSTESEIYFGRLRYKMCNYLKRVHTSFFTQTSIPGKLNKVKDYDPIS